MIKEWKFLESILREENEEKWWNGWQYKQILAKIDSRHNINLLSQ